MKLLGSNPSGSAVKADGEDPWTPECRAVGACGEFIVQFDVGVTIKNRLGGDANIGAGHMKTWTRM